MEVSLHTKGRQETGWKLGCIPKVKRSIVEVTVSCTTKVERKQGGSYRLLTKGRKEAVWKLGYIPKVERKQGGS